MIQSVLDALTTIVEPESGRDIVRLGYIRDLKVDSEVISFTLLLPDPSTAFASNIERFALEAVQPIAEGRRIEVARDNEMIGLGTDIQVGEAGTSGAPGNVRNMIAVASGKGGVGKSTVAVNLAVALAAEGYDVGLVDTDIYGPSIPTMFGVEDAKPRVNEHRRIVPIEKFGVKILSMGFLVDPEKAVIWRGPMVTSAVKQFLGDTEWGDLDFLILDLPPGTGDIQLTIVQTVPLTGAVIVSTPQRVALADARKGVAMFEQVNVPVLGVIENMAYFTPDELPDRKYYLFGEGGARELAGSLDVPFLGELPIRESIRENCDAGTPIAAMKGDLTAEQFGSIARDLVRRTAIRNATRPATAKIDIIHR